MSITLEIDESLAYFHINMKNCTQTIMLCEPCIRSIKEWQQFADDMMKGNKNSLGFYCGNGHGYMECDKDDIIFSAMPSGGGGDFGVTVKLDRLTYKDDMYSVIEQLLDNFESLNDQ